MGWRGGGRLVESHATGLAGPDIAAARHGFLLGGMNDISPSSQRLMQSFDLREHPLAEERRTTDLRSPEVRLHPDTFAAFFSAECKSLSTQNHGNCGFLSQSEGTPSGIIIEYFKMVDRSLQANGHLPCFFFLEQVSSVLSVSGKNGLPHLMYYITEFNARGFCVW